MKMQPEHYIHLRAALTACDTDYHRARYQAARLTARRYQWDLVRYASLMPWLCDTLYSYLSDNHIQTALDKIVRPL